MAHKIFIVGVGMGNPSTLTLAAREALAHSGLIVGSTRLLESLGDLLHAPDAVSRPARLVAEVRSEMIAQLVAAAPEEVASVVMSGDVGFYSGATPLLARLEEAEMADCVEVIPGISSLAYLCARLHEPWHDAHVVSAHGRAHDAVGAIQSHAKTFVLMGGADSAQDLCAQLAERGLGEVRVTVGECLSYADERITRGTAAELAHQQFAGLSVMLAINKHPLRPGILAPHLPDAVFERGSVPMSKEEVRELAVCKLRVSSQDIVWDVGAGTGSVSVELARAAYAGQVFAVEKNTEAQALIERNAAAFGLTNLQVVAGEAPQVLAGLPAPDCVFVGGSTGRLDAILEAVLAANPAAHVCVAAITLETLSAALAFVQERGIGDVDIAQVSVSKARAAGPSHLMLAHNPVYLITFGNSS